MKNLLTDIELRGHWFKTRSPWYEVEEGVFITPAARDFIREHDIELRYKGRNTMTVSSSSDKIVGAPYVDAETGSPIYEKGERLTHLSGNKLVSKCSKRIAFRGKLDTLSSLIVLTESQTKADGFPEMVRDLDELLKCVHGVLAAEVKGEEYEPPRLLGYSSEELRRASQNVKESIGINHPIPSGDMCQTFLRVNYLRTQIRETELAAHLAMPEKENDGIIQALNRLSSAAYIIFCRGLAGYYVERK